jgi:hypothetical protein
MSNIVLTLGGVTFQDFEVPEKITLGNTQRVAMHELIGGGQVVDALGDAMGKIALAGVFSGADAAARAQSLEGATALGAQLPMLWDCFFYTVIIETFEAEYEKPWWIPFSLVCQIVFDPVAAVADSVSSLTNLVAGDVASAVALAPQAGLALGLSGVPGAAALAAAQGVVAAGITASDAALTAGGAFFDGAVDAVSGAAGLTQLVGVSGQLAAVTGLSSYINRAATNTANELL